MAEQGGIKPTRRGFMKKAAFAAAAATLITGDVRTKHAGLAPTSRGKMPPRDNIALSPGQEAPEDFAAFGVRRLSELDRLPWFEKNDKGQICLRPAEGLPPIIDTHGHVGWAQGVGKPLDMKRRCPVQFFYDYEPDQDVLGEQDHPTNKESKTISREILTSPFRTPQRNLTQSAANLAADLDRTGCKNMVLLAVEIPGKSRHAADSLAASRLDDRFIPFGAVHPAPWNAHKVARLERQLADYAIKGLKFHPVFQFIAPDHRASMAMFEWCESKNLVLCAHVGFTGREPLFMREKSAPCRYLKMLQAFPKLRVILAHTGIRLIDETLEIAKRFEDRVWLDISGQPAPNIAYILNRYDTDKILYASDWPFMPCEIMLARTLAATEKCRHLRVKLLHDNAARLLNL